MARLIGPDEASRRVDAEVGKTFLSKSGSRAQLWADDAATVPADVLYLDGSPIPLQQPDPARGVAPTVPVGAGSMLPLIQYPDGVDFVVVTCDGGPPWRAYARTDDRLDALGQRVGTVEGVADAAETPAGAQAKADAAQAAATTYADARRRVTQPLLRPVTWRANNLGASTFLTPAGKERASFRVQHKLIRGMRAGGIRLLYANHNGASVAPNSVTVRAHVEINGKGYPVFFGGVRAVTIIPGGHVVSDPLPVTITDVEVPWLYTLTYVDAGAGGRIPIGLTTRTTNGEGSNLADTTAGGPDLTVTDYGTNVTNPSFVAAGAYSPMAVLGIPQDADLPAVCVVGDSISVGAGDGGPAWPSAAPSGDFGFILRALQDSGGPLIPYLYSARFGETASSAASIPSRFFRGYAMDYCTDVVEQYGTNDVNAGTTAANIETYRSQLWMLGKARGRRVWATTITPRTTSTDAWATVANQTVQANDAARVAVNDWIRAGAPLDPSTFVPVAVGTAGAVVAGDAAHPLVGYFEVADAAESARNSGRWKAGYTGDGIHPNATASAAMAAVIDPGLFGL